MIANSKSPSFLTSPWPPRFYFRIPFHFPSRVVHRAMTLSSTIQSRFKLSNVFRSARERRRRSPVLAWIQASSSASADTAHIIFNPLRTSLSLMFLSSCTTKVGATAASAIRWRRNSAARCSLRWGWLPQWSPPALDSVHLRISRASTLSHIIQLLNHIIQRFFKRRWRPSGILPCFR